MYTQTAITVFNKRLGEDRREVFFPTSISSASYAESIGSGHSDSAHAQQRSFKLRIPFGAVVQGGRPFVREAAYRLLDDAQAADAWTLQTGDYIVPTATDLSAPINITELRSLAAGTRLIAVKEYADNTLRGSDAVKHWRIGGE